MAVLLPRVPVDLRVEIFLEAIGTAAIIVLTYELVQVSHKSAQAAAAATAMSETLASRDQARFTVFPTSLSVSSDGVLFYEFEVANAGWHDSAIAGAALLVFQRDQKEPSQTFPIRALRRRQGNATSFDLMVRSGDRLLFAGEILERLVDWKTADRVVLEVKPVLGIAGTAEIPVQ